MTYVDSHLRFSLDECSIRPLRRRSEGRLKTIDSNDDLRSWNYTVEDRRHHILDVVRRDIAKCGDLSTAVLHAYSQKSKADLAKCLKSLWDFLISRNLSPEDQEQLNQLQQQMGYVCVKAIQDCCCTGDYELACICDDKSSTKLRDQLFNTLDTIEFKKQPECPKPGLKKKKPCVCEENAGDGGTASQYKKHHTTGLAHKVLSVAKSTKQSAHSAASKASFPSGEVSTRSAASKASGRSGISEASARSGTSKASNRPGIHEAASKASDRSGVNEVSARSGSSKASGRSGVSETSGATKVSGFSGSSEASAHSGASKVSGRSGSSAASARSGGSKASSRSVVSEAEEHLGVINYDGHHTSKIRSAEGGKDAHRNQFLGDEDPQHQFLAPMQSGKGTFRNQYLGDEDLQQQFEGTEQGGKGAARNQYQGNENPQHKLASPGVGGKGAVDSQYQADENPQHHYGDPGQSGKEAFRNQYQANEDQFGSPMQGEKEAIRGQYDQTSSAKIKGTCPPNCVRFKANLPRSKSSSLAENPRQFDEEHHREASIQFQTNNVGSPSTQVSVPSNTGSPSTQASVQSNVGSPSTHAKTIDSETDGGAPKRKKSRIICECSEKSTSTPNITKMVKNIKVETTPPAAAAPSKLEPSYQSLKAAVANLECLCKEQEASIKALQNERDEIDKKNKQNLQHDMPEGGWAPLGEGKSFDPCKQEINEFEKELNLINRGAISPEIEASIIKKELEILRQYCMKLKAVEEENERLKNERKQLGGQPRQKLRDSRASGAGVSEFDEYTDNECEACEALKNKINMLERRLGKCTNTLPEDFEIYKNRSELLDSTLAERDEMQKKIENLKDLENQLEEYKKKAAKADELERRVMTMEKDKKSTYDLRKVQSRCICVQRELENVRAEKDAIHRRLEMMKDEMDRLRAKAKEAEVLLVERDKLQIKLNDLAHVHIHNENLRLKCKCLENSASERDMYKQKYEEHLSMECNCEKQKAQMEENSNLRRERDCLKNQVADLQSCIIDQENEIRRLMEQIESLIKNKDEIQVRMKEALASMRAEIEKKDQLIAAADNKLDKMQYELKSSIQGVSCETTCYKTRIEELERELCGAKTQIIKIERSANDRQDSMRKKEMEIEALSTMKKELQAANAENNKLQEIAHNMAILTGDEHVQKMLRQSECAVRRVLEELSRQYREWDNLKSERRRQRSGDSYHSSNKLDQGMEDTPKSKQDKDNRCRGTCSYKIGER